MKAKKLKDLKDRIVFTFFKRKKSAVSKLQCQLKGVAIHKSIASERTFEATINSWEFVKC